MADTKQKNITTPPKKNKQKAAQKEKTTTSTSHFEKKNTHKKKQQQHTHTHSNIKKRKASLRGKTPAQLFGKAGASEDGYRLQTLKLPRRATVTTGVCLKWRGVER